MIQTKPSAALPLPVNFPPKLTIDEDESSKPFEKLLTKPAPAINPECFKLDKFTDSKGKKLSKY
jgi:hypothetical protein